MTVSLPLVLLLGVICAALVKYEHQKASGILVGALFGLSLAATPVGPPIYDAVHSLSGTVLDMLGSLWDTIVAALKGAFQ